MRLYAGQNPGSDFVSVYNFMNIIVYICYHDGKLEEAHLHIAIYTRKSVIHTKDIGNCKIYNSYFKIIVTLESTYVWWSMVFRLCADRNDVTR